MEDKAATDICSRHDTMHRERSELDSTYQSLKDLVRPDTAEFHGGSGRAADARRKIYDGTAPWALDQLVSGVHSYVTSPVDRWFSLGLKGVPPDQLSFEEKAWLEEVSDIIYSHYANPHASFNPSMHELYMDLGAFGTGAIYQWFDLRRSRLAFRSFPLATCYIEEDAAGEVTRVHRVIKWTKRQLIHEFGAENLPPKTAKRDDNDKLTIIHAVFLRERTEMPVGRNPKGRRWASFFVCKDENEVILESGFDWNPYHTPRWSKIPGEVYGRGPGMAVLPEIRMVNLISKTMIKAAQKLVDPPLIVPDDGFLAPLRTLPGGLNYARPGTEKVEPLPTAQRLDITTDFIEQRREMIRRGFYVDWLVRPQKKERQSAQEIMDDRNQMLSMMAPAVGRLHSELTGPTIRLSYNLLNRHNKLPPQPASLLGEELDIVYVSPAAKAQSTARGQGMMAYIQQLQALQPVFPHLALGVDEIALNAELQNLTDVSRRVLRSPEDTERRLAEQKEQEQMAMAAEALPKVASASKDMAVAQNQ